MNNLASLLHLSANKFLFRIVIFVINACELGGRKSRQNIFIFPVPFSFSGINDNERRTIHTCFTYTFYTFFIYINPVYFCMHYKYNIELGNKRDTSCRKEYYECVLPFSFSPLSAFSCIANVMMMMILCLVTLFPALPISLSFYLSFSVCIRYKMYFFSRKERKYVTISQLHATMQPNNIIFVFSLQSCVAFFLSSFNLSSPTFLHATHFTHSSRITQRSIKRRCSWIIPIFSTCFSFS